MRNNSRSYLIYYFTVLIFLLPLVVLSQGVRKLGTQRMKAIIEVDPLVIAKRSEIERQIKRNRLTQQIGEITIPVVFHVLYAPGSDYPSAAQIQSQIDALNRDFSLEEYLAGLYPDTPERFELNLGSTGIQFCLPYSNGGADLVGINYVLSAKEEWGFEQTIKDSISGGQNVWYPDNLLNVWVVNLNDSISGWAQLPGGPQATDGIVIDYTYFGSTGLAEAPYDQGKTLTHLVGNYLGLYDLWNESLRCSDDYVADTPIHNAPNNKCYSQEIHISACNNNPREMTMNFMDNTPDNCTYLFSAGQRTRMQAVLAQGGPRDKLLNLEAGCLLGDSIMVLANPIVSTSSSATQSSRVNVFPNPTDQNLVVEVTTVESSTVNMKVFDNLGREVITVNNLLPDATGFSHTIDCGKWAAGIYFIRVSIGEDQSVHRIVVNH